MSLTKLAHDLNLVKYEGASEYNRSPANMFSVIVFVLLLLASLIFLLCSADLGLPFILTDMTSFSSSDSLRPGFPRFASLIFFLVSGVFAGFLLPFLEQDRHSVFRRASSPHLSLGGLQSLGFLQVGQGISII